MHIQTSSEVECRFSVRQSTVWHSRVYCNPMYNKGVPRIFVWGPHWTPVH